MTNLIIMGDFGVVLFGVTMIVALNWSGANVRDRTISALLVCVPFAAMAFGVTSEAFYGITDVLIILYSMARLAMIAATPNPNGPLYHVGMTGHFTRRRIYHRS